MSKHVLPTTVFCVLLLFAANAWTLDLEDGRYEITSTVKMEGVPMQPPPTTITECLTKQDPVPNQQADGGKCKITNMKTTGDTVTWEMECNQQGQQMKSKGQMAYRGKHFEGTVHTQIGPQAGSMKMTTTIKGKRIGDCQ